MKRTVLAFLFLIAGMCVFAQNGVIKEMVGNVEIKNPGAADFTAAKAGDVVSQKTVVSTGFKSTALLEVGSSVLTVRPLTRLTLSEITASAGSETLNVSLQTGRVRVDVNPPAGSKANMSIKGPTSTASVRGTSFEFDTRNLYVNHGKVSFKGNRGAGMLVSAGFSSQIDDDGKAVNPIETRNGSLLPPVPAGASDIGGDSGAAVVPQVPESGSFTITLDY